MTIIGLFYLLLIVGWIFLIIVLKCKRARAKRLAEEQAAQAAQCHIIQIGSNYYDIIPSNHPFNSSNYRSCSTLHLDETNNNINSSNNINHTDGGRESHTNPAFIIDEVGNGGGGGGIFPTNGVLPDLPPSYDDVMRLPSSYPKVAPMVVTTPSSRLATAPPEMVPRYEGPAIIEVTNVEPNRIDTNNNNHQVTHQTTICTCSSNINNNNNNSSLNNNSSSNGITVRRQSDTT